MDRRGDDSARPAYVRFGGWAGSMSGDRLLSRTALRLHVCAILVSIEAGRPGLITDDYLNAVTGETSLSALELCTAGLWTRVDEDSGAGCSGYVVPESEILRMANEVRRQVESQRSRTGDGRG